MKLTLSGDCAIDCLDEYTQLEIKVEDFCRIFAHCSFDVMLICRSFKRNRIFPGEYYVAVLRPALKFPQEKDFHCSIVFWHCKFIGREMVDAIERILNSTQPKVCNLKTISDRDHCFHLTKSLSLSFSFIISALSYFYLNSYAVLFSKFAESKRNIESFDFHLRNEIDVDSLLRDLANLEKTGDGKWFLRVFYNPYCLMNWSCFCLFFTKPNSM
uniref:MATH domain-containing protein n=1 Tax=Heterorhabditis bacteriophora TaxID=37862 RepID=A0A1I7WCX1_HETBA